jgi:hypothetical protein
VFGWVWPVEAIAEQLKQAGVDARIKLTDKYPNLESIQKWAESAPGEIEYLAEPVDAMHVPHHLRGMRTLFEGFHHFKPEQAQSILQEAQENRVAIGIFEATLKPPLGLFLLLLAPLVTFLSYLVITPFIMPRTWSRFIWTYLIPVVPLATCWDWSRIAIEGVFRPGVERTDRSASKHRVCLGKRSSIYWDTGIRIHLLDRISGLRGQSALLEQPRLWLKSLAAHHETPNLSGFLFFMLALH